MGTRTCTNLYTPGNTYVVLRVRTTLLLKKLKIQKQKIITDLYINNYRANK